MSKVSDERLIADLLDLGSVSAVARKNRLSPSAVYKRMRSDDFRQRLQSEQDSMIQATSGALAASLETAAQTLADVCANPLNAPGLRISAADALLRHGLRYVETANVLRRIAALEEASQHDD